MLLSLTTGLAILGAVSAHTGCGGHEIGARNLGGRVISKRQVADNVEGESRFRFSDLGREVSHAATATLSHHISQPEPVWYISYDCRMRSDARSRLAVLIVSSTSPSTARGPQHKLRLTLNTECLPSPSL